MLDAKKRLTQQEYLYISVIYETYKMITNPLLLDYMGFIGVCNVIIAHFDLVAPYYKFCGSNELTMAEFFDNEKTVYRKKAKELLDEKKLFKEDWMALHKKFMEEFY